MNANPDSLSRSLAECEQQHLLHWWPELTAEEQQQLQQQIDSVDFPALRAIWKQHADADAAEPSEDMPRAERAAAPGHVVRQPADDADRQRWKDAAARGALLLSSDRCGVITVAGGQGTRLGFDKPKGMFPIGPITGRTLFQVFAEQIAAMRIRYHCSLPWLIMTSDATHDATVEFFREHDFFGLDGDSVQFFCQASLPALDAATGKALMQTRSSLCLSPDGHGGLVSALDRAGLLRKLRARGIEHLYYHQVDNPTVRICDSAFLGFHSLEESQMTTLAVEKTDPSERMGVLVDIDGRTEIIEYSELSPEQSARRDDNGQWIFWAGSTAIHAFTLEFLESLAEDDCRLPLHVAKKRVPHLNAQGERVEPSLDEPPNAVKLERFIFDALPLASRSLVVEGNRDREFNPVKNADGADSPATARAALNRIGREWFAAAGITVPESQGVEISPLIALDEHELADRLSSGEVSVNDLTE